MRFHPEVGNDDALVRHIAGMPGGSYVPADWNVGPYSIVRVTVHRDSDVLDTVADAFPPYRDMENWDLVFVVPKLACDIITWHERDGEYLTEVITWEAFLGDAHDYANAYTAILVAAGDRHAPEDVLSYCIEQAEKAELDWRQVVPIATSLWVADDDYTDNIARALLVHA